MNEPELDIDSMPVMDRTILRLQHFKEKYGYDLDGLIYITTQDTSLRMDIRDNLDYVEIVGLLNQLCLEMGDHFASEEEGKQQ